MKLTIYVRDGFLEDVARGFAVDGSNDDEHDLLGEMADNVREAMRAAGADMTAIDDLWACANNLEELNEG